MIRKARLVPVARMARRRIAVTASGRRSQDSTIARVSWPRAAEAVESAPFDATRNSVLFCVGLTMKFPTPKWRVWTLAAAVVTIAFAAWFPALGDVVTLHSGRTVEGRVLTVDDRWVVVETDSERVRIERERVASITFADEAPPPLKVEVRNVLADDSIDVLFNDEVVIRDARTGGSWIDLTSMLKDGNNSLRFRIRNARGTWGYVVHVRINGTVTRLQCGDPPRADSPCDCCGKTGTETGIIDDLPPMWIFADRAAGDAEVIR